MFTRLAAIPYSLMAVTSLGFAFWSCVKVDPNAETSGVRKKIVPPPKEPTKGPFPEVPVKNACDIGCNVTTTVDDWTVQYQPGWGANVLVTLVDPNNPASLVFTHPTQELARKSIVTEAPCVEANGDSLLDKNYPVVDGVNLFSQVSAQGSGSYKHVFINTDKKYIAVANGDDGCSPANQNKPGSCYVWGEVQGSRVILIQNSCIAGYTIQARTTGLGQKKICNSNNTINVQGQVYPAAFVLIHDPFRPLNKDEVCKQQPQPTPTYVPPIDDPTPKQPPVPPEPTPTVTAIPPTVIPTQSPSPAPSPCPVWTKDGCKGQWTK
jgi:hypothetical protein